MNWPLTPADSGEESHETAFATFEAETKCWDGAVRGQRAIVGTYFYVIEVEDAKNEKASYRGSFTLLD